MSEVFPRAGFFKRIAAIIYDWLAIVAIAMLVTVLNLILVQVLVSYQLLTLPLEVEPSTYLNKSWWFQIELALVTWFFYAWFWHDGGQTLGMRAWRLKVQMQSGQPLTLKTAWIRGFYSVLGLGNLLVLFTPKTRFALQDRLSNTEVVVLSKNANRQVYLRGVEAPNRK